MLSSKVLPLLLLILILIGCQQLPFPIDLQKSLGDYREGTKTFTVPVAIKNITLRTDPRTIDFGKPSPPLTYATANARIAFTLLNQDKEPIQGKALLKLYISPAGMEPWSNSFLVLSKELTLGVDQSIELTAQLTRAQLQAVNQGRVALGIEVDLTMNAYYNAVTLYWKFEKLLIGVGII